MKSQPHPHPHPHPAHRRSHRGLLVSRHRSSVGPRWPSKRIAALHRLPIRLVLAARFALRCAPMAARSLRHLTGDATLGDFVAYLKANPGRLNYGSTGVGTSSHLSGFMLTERIDTPATHVPYKGADALNDLLAGRIQFMFATIPSVIAHIRAGKLNALAVTSARRSRSLPDLPTVAEKGFPGFEA